MYYISRFCDFRDITSMTKLSPFMIGKLSTKF